MSFLEKCKLWVAKQLFMICVVIVGKAYIEKIVGSKNLKSENE